MDEPVKPVTWKGLSGEERYRVVELARQDETSIRELCRTFGVSRQTLYRALEAADRASVEALTPKRRGRKARPDAQAVARAAPPGAQECNSHVVFLAVADAFVGSAASSRALCGASFISF